MGLSSAIELGPRSVFCGSRGDPNRIGRLLQPNFPQCLLGNDITCVNDEVRRAALNPDRFRDHGEPERHGIGEDQWPEGICNEIQFVLTFNQSFDGMDGLAEAVLSAGFFLSGLLSLASWCNYESIISLKKLHPWTFICISDFGSLWRGDDNRLYNPTLYLNDAVVGGHWLGYAIYRGTPILASRPWYDE